MILKKENQLPGALGSYQLLLINFFVRVKHLFVIIVSHIRADTLFFVNIIFYFKMILK